VIFLSPLAVFSRDRFLPTNRVVELLFPRLDPVVDVILLAFKTMEFVLFCFVFFFSSSRSLTRRFILRRPVESYCYHSCHWLSVWPDFILSSIF
jgi:hypothetical protein